MATRYDSCFLTAADRKTAGQLSDRRPGANTLFATYVPKDKAQDSGKKL